MIDTSRTWTARELAEILKASETRVLGLLQTREIDAPYVGVGKNGRPMKAYNWENLCELGLFMTLYDMGCRGELAGAIVDVALRDFADMVAGDEACPLYYRATTTSGVFYAITPYVADLEAVNDLTGDEVDGVLVKVDKIIRTIREGVKH